MKAESIVAVEKHTFEALYSSVTHVCGIGIEQDIEPIQMYAEELGVSPSALLETFRRFPLPLARAIWTLLFKAKKYIEMLYGPHSSEKLQREFSRETIMSLQLEESIPLILLQPCNANLRHQRTLRPSVRRECLRLIDYMR